MIMVWKSTFVGMALISAPLCVAAQEPLSRDTIRTELSSDFIKQIGDTTDLVTANDQTSNWFISLSGGVNAYAGEKNRVYDNFIDRSRLSIRLSAGKWIHPLWGIRLQMGVGKLSGHYQPFSFYNLYDQAADHTVMPEEMRPDVSEKDGVTWVHRKFTYLDWQVDFMTDVVRWFAKKPQPVGFYLFAGPGFAHGFASQGLSATNSFALKAGAQLNVSIHENWDIFAELQGTMVDESFDGQIGGTPGERNRPLEGYAGLTIGFSYKFGGKKFKRYAQVHPVTYEEIRRIQPPKRVEVTQEVKKDILTDFVVRFFIDRSNIEEDQKGNINRVAQYLKEHPEARLRITGYADRETAYPEYNLRLSQRRVNAVQEYLVDECGIDPARLITDAKGDTERVYDEDFRWNRVVVMNVIENEDKE